MAQDQVAKDVAEIFGLLRDQQRLIADLSTQVAVLVDRDRRQTADLDALEKLVIELRDECASLRNKIGRLGWLGSIALAVTAAIGAALKGMASLWAAISGGAH